MFELERRVFAVQELRISGDGDDEPKRLAGHAAVFNSPSKDLGGFTEVVARGAFKESIGKDDIRALFNHNPDYVLGRNQSGTLKLKEDRDGLAIDVEPPDTQWARDLSVSIERGDITQMSFGFRTSEDKWETKDGKNVRTLRKVQLMDVSPVTYPAYPKTDVALRSLELWQAGERPDVWLEDAGRRQRLTEAEIGLTSADA